MRQVLEISGGLWALFRLGIRSRFRWRGRYWSWRRETAFGTQRLRRGEELRSILAYGRWVYRMQRAQRARGERRG